MKLTSWYKKRGISFIIKRAQKLNERYSLNPRKSILRIEHCVDALQEFGCLPTFAVPGSVVERSKSFFQGLQKIGVEIAVHGYNHVDLKAYPAEDASRQLKHAFQVFRTNGLEAHGFRCPYLSLSDNLMKALPAGLFEYSSNRAIQWSIDPSFDPPENTLFEKIEGFYEPVKSGSALSLPWFQDGLVEIPVCVPDDLQMHDGLGFNTEQISKIWLDIFNETYLHGEIFNLMFHPELASFCEAPFLAVLQEARRLQPGVWIARLHEISDWWKEKSSFDFNIKPSGDGFILNFSGSPRATILCRGFDPGIPTEPFDTAYRRLWTHSVQLNLRQLPLIGLPASAPEWVPAALLRMGYFVEISNTPGRYSLYLDQTCLDSFETPRQLILFIESSPVPLVRLWPWPDGKRSALSITGDLDALSFFDYALRLLK